MIGRFGKSVVWIAGGPFSLWREHRGAVLPLSLLALALAVLSPACGILLWLSLPPLGRLTRRLHRLRLLAALAVFCAIYVPIAFAVVPGIGRQFGRVALPRSASKEAPLRPANLGFSLLGRNYIRPECARVAEAVAREVVAAHGGAITYLDAGFPLGGVPLIPHLSHSDGRKLDVAFRYRSRSTGLPVDSSPSPVGYWVYEPPRRGEPAPCDDRDGALRWDFRWFQWLGSRHEVDEAATRDLILAFAARPEVEKILLEPHLKERFEIRNPKVRFQGCEAARHDDHFHVQFR